MLNAYKCRSRFLFTSFFSPRRCLFLFEATSMPHQRKFYVIQAYLYRYPHIQVRTNALQFQKNERTKKTKKETIFLSHVILLMNLYEFTELTSIVSRFIYISLHTSLLYTCFLSDFYHGATAFLFALCVDACYCCCCCSGAVVGGWLKEACVSKTSIQIYRCIFNACG